MIAAANHEPNLNQLDQHSQADDAHNKLGNHEEENGSTISHIYSPKRTDSSYPKYGYVAVTLSYATR